LLPRETGSGRGQGIWVLPGHQEYQDVEGDLHWINFDRDVFVLKLPTGFQTNHDPELRCQFNFGLDVSKRIRQLEACSAPDMLKMQGMRWVLSGMLQWPELQTVQIYLHREDANTHRTDPMAFGELGLELKKSSVYPVLKSYLGKGMSKEVRAKICMKEAVVGETKEKRTPALLNVPRAPHPSTVCLGPFPQTEGSGTPGSFSSRGEGLLD